MIRILRAHFLISFFQSARQPAYLMSTLIFPSLFFFFFASPNVQSEPQAHMMMASFAAFAVLSVVFLQFGVEMANERHSPWNHFVRTLPVRLEWQMLARILVSLIFATAAALLVMVTVHALHGTNLSLSAWLRFVGVVILGGFSFAFWALALSYLVSPQSALPVINLAYLSLSFAGGLWLPPDALGTRMQEISHFVPTRHYGELCWSVVLDRPAPAESAWLLAAYSVAGLMMLMVLIRWRSRHVPR